ncbi:MAG: glycerol-3-phosphate 1-O-acyltransferase PlsY [Firmicutes bacterium]|nr:glycerol-3-phosphate 1-O-acyltransferase PlsY [Bacillota bacterium]
MFRVVCLIIGYFLGSISFAYIMGKISKRDLRKEGSGNLGTTNTLRVLGKRAGAITFVLDIAKALASFYIGCALFPEAGFLAGFYGGAGAVLGHDFPFYLKFKGGKGIASTIGLMIAFWNVDTLITIGIGVAFGLSGYISLGSITFVIAIPITLWLKGYPAEIVLVSAILSVIALIKHKDNIKRLRSGTENKLFFKNKNV